MLIALSPAKSLDYNTPIPHSDAIQLSLPTFMPQAARLISLLKKQNSLELMQLMGISESLAQLNKERYAAWVKSPSLEQGKAAIFAFNGDVYEGLDAYSLNLKQLNYVQKHTRILSGIYGVLRPFDLLQAYRLEMGTRLTNPKGANLYAFWGDTIADNLRAVLSEHKEQVVINLASDEYFKSVRLPALKAEVITPVFQDWKNDRYKIISFYAKRARGLMARYCAQHQITNPEQLKQFDLDGYAYDADNSDQQRWMFRRRLAAS
ncbi:peroxide stress protein YaaA [Solimicrobium silvestre]|uniref:UPF0246 protein S2091_3981 n=1 Tax=Solimicrobium silvestre TaxID=2099400 RepID=A0A2S9GUC4_9BURK|nr:peroxide stress protein YaaA [Solimicrobium silvestre]PRC91310.1 hypothetical protein S2091_3981 [Solimicrobium silvestre]